ncbi:hypothetical protein QP185_21700 [Sphingomonas aerolata]|uniref:hypothetical protein n=1 Tax=Sphingomonas aerolata TaxID=185951 RepID=UPI002FE03CDF
MRSQSGPGRRSYVNGRHGPDRFDRRREQRGYKRDVRELGLFLEESIFRQTTEFYNLNPSLTWAPSDTFKVEAQVNYGKSTFYREQPSFLIQTPREAGINAFYDNTDSKNPQPIVTSNVDLGDPNLGWQWYRQNVQSVRRKTETKGAHVDFTLGDANMNLKFGGAYDSAQRNVRAYDNSTAHQTSVAADAHGTHRQRH